MSPDDRSGAAVPVASNRTRTIVAVALFTNEIIAIVCQFIQNTDPRFPLVYFTVASAALTAAVIAIGQVWPPWHWLPPLRIAAAVGVLLSAVIFACVIAPASSTGTWFQPWDDYWVRTSTVLMHGTAPVLVVADIAQRPAWRGLSAWLAAGTSWPLIYVSTMCLLVGAGALEMPYPFLSPTQMGWGVVVGALAAQILLVAVISAILLAVNLRTGARCVRATGPPS